MQDLCHYEAGIKYKFIHNLISISTQLIIISNSMHAYDAKKNLVKYGEHE